METKKYVCPKHGQVLYEEVDIELSPEGEVTMDPHIDPKPFMSSKRVHKNCGLPVEIFN